MTYWKVEWEKALAWVAGVSENFRIWTDIRISLSSKACQKGLIVLDLAGLGTWGGSKDSGKIGTGILFPSRYLSWLEGQCIVPTFCQCLSLSNGPPRAADIVRVSPNLISESDALEWLLPLYFHMKHELARHPILQLAHSYHCEHHRARANTSLGRPWFISPCLVVGYMSRYK